MFDPNNKKFIKDIKYNEPGKLPEVKESTMLKFDPTKPYRRRDGKPAKIVHTFDNDKFLVVSEYQHYIVLPDGTEYGTAWESIIDLINIPEKIEGWVNVYKDHFGELKHGWLYDTKEQATKFSAPNCIACIKVSFTEGEGLE